MKSLKYFLVILQITIGLTSPSPPQHGAKGGKLPLFHDPHFFPNRSVIIHLHEWKFSDIARECEEYLGPKGYAGVQVSPASENLIMKGRPWYERYQPISMEIKTRSGDIADFQDMTRRCNRVGVRIYVDVVINHMTANADNARGTGGSIADAHDFSFPAVPFDRSDFHYPACQMQDLSDPVEARNCELVGLHDLDHSKPRVRWAIILFLDRLLALGAAGFRVDATKHMWPQDLDYIYSHVSDLSVDEGFNPGSRPFIFQEVGDNWKYNYTQFGAVTEFQHSFNIAGAMKGDQKLATFKTYGPGPEWNLLPSESALVFVDNHDLQRQNPYTINYKNAKLFKMGYAFTLAWPFGVPRVMSSFDFHDDQDGPPADAQENILAPEIDENGQCINGWVCEHRWNAIVNMVEFRAIAGDSPVKSWYDDGDGVAAFCRGDRGFVALNIGKVDFSGKLQTCLPQGVYCDVITGKLDQGRCTGLSLKVDESGNADVNLPKDAEEGVLAIHIDSKCDQCNSS